MGMTIGSNLPPLVETPPGAGFVGEAPGGHPGLLSGASVRVTAGAASAAGGVDPKVEGDLRRDDTLGGMFRNAFILPAPAMPEELKG